MHYDKGYHTGSEFQIANQLGIDVLLAIPRVASNAPNPHYNVSQFIYDKTNDNYLCPEGKHLETNGNSYKAKTYNFKRYLTTAVKLVQSNQHVAKQNMAKPSSAANTKKYIERAEADLGLMFTSYNLRRLINIIGLESLQSYLQELLSLLFCYILLLRQKNEPF